jgi:hypothetical protein
MRGAGHVVRVGDMRNSYNILVGKPAGKVHLEDLGIYERIILECIIEK